MITSKTGLVDANVLVYAINENAKQHAASLKLVESGLNGEIPVCFTPQVFSEFFATVTNRKQITSVLSREKALSEIEDYFLKGESDLVFVHRGTLDKIIELLKKYPVNAQDIFDLQLVATMLSNNITRIYTYNEKDFSKYAEIEVLNPESVIQ
ncbi:MAG: type II toxin-antitoxin system VapC family toxin [Ignavibacteriaceae bacterium]